MTYLQSLTKTATALGRTSSLFFGLPFDVARERYANAVRVGLIQQSMLSGAKFEQDLVALEKLTLGPLARRV